MTMLEFAPKAAVFTRWRPRRLLPTWGPLNSARVREALLHEELAGYRYVLYGWLFALAVISLYLIVTIPFQRTIYYLGIVLVFAAIGLAGESLRRTWPHQARVLMGAILLLQISLLTAVLIVPDPLIASDAPPQIAFRTANFLYLYAFVVSTVLSYSPGLMLWTGVVAAVDWAIGFAIFYSLPDTVSPGRISLLNVPDLTLNERLKIFLDPHFMSYVTFRTQVLLLLLTSAILALAVWRARRLVLREMTAESARANLARYFSPDLVDELAAGSDGLDTSRAEDVGVLFVDVVGFTALAENLPPERAIELLRSFHTRMSDTVFRFGGTVDKYIGDEVMATFGTPRRRPDDADRLFACACAMIGEIERWSAKRARRGAAPVRVGIGIHYGRVVIGNVGGERCLEFTVIGDTVNVASRLERLTRERSLAVATSGEAVAALERAGGRLTTLPLTFRHGGPMTLRGRAAPVEVWGADWPETNR
jgi:adenylate cyclase